MTAPPGSARKVSAPRSISFSDIEALKAAARTVLWNCGIDFGPNRINKLCVRFVNRVHGNGFDFFDFLANQVELTADQRRSALADPEVQRVIAYADPTGEAAVDRVMRSGA